MVFEAVAVHVVTVSNDNWMKRFLEKNGDPVLNSCKKDSSFNCKPKQSPGSVSDETEPSVSGSKNQNSVVWWGIKPLSLSIFGNLYYSSSRCESQKSSASGKNHYERWRAAVRRVMMNSGAMRRLLGFSRTGVSASNSDIWLLGICYQVCQEGENANSLDPTHSEGFAAFVEDFSSRVWITYRKGSACWEFGRASLMRILQCK